MNDLAVYPQTVVYSNGKYRIRFEREERKDYKHNWTTTESKVFFSRYRLKNIYLEHLEDSTWVTIRRYGFVYADNQADDNVIQPGLKWIWGVNETTEWARTLTLTSITEFGTDAISLPPIKLYYDNYHLIQVDNGYGGQIDFGYERWSYFDDINKDLRSAKPNTVCGTILPDGWSYYSGNQSYVRCDPVKHLLQIGQDGHGAGSAKYSIPESLLKPGAYYRFLIKAQAIQSPSGIVWGFVDTSTNQTSLPGNANIGDGSYESTVRLPEDFEATASSLLIECDDCWVKEVELVLFPSIYRVSQKTIIDTIPNPNQENTYLYRYDNAAPNSKANSDAVVAANGSSESLYNYAMREYRGNAITQVTDPAGLTQILWTAQSDNLKGQGYHNLNMQQFFWSEFENADYQESSWSLPLNYSGRAGYYQEDFDQALYLFNNGSPTVSSLNRSSYSLENSAAVLALFRLDKRLPVMNDKNEYEQITGTAEMQIGIGSANGNFFGIHVTESGNGVADLKLRYNNGSVLVDGLDLIPPDTFKLGQWYTLLIIPDPQAGFLARVWSLTNPDQIGEQKLPGFSVQSWRFEEEVKNGSLWLDAYSEGIVYSESYTTFTSDIQYYQDGGSLGSDNYDAIADNKLKTYFDLGVTWSYPVETVKRNYDAHASTGEGASLWLGTRTQYFYESTAQNNQQFGNLTSLLESGGDGNGWEVKRIKQTLFWPQNSTAFLVSLPAGQQEYQCENADCSNKTLTAATYYLYDHNSSYTQAPTQGILAWARQLLDNSSGNTYNDTSFEYDDYGNLIDTVRYRQAGTETTLANQGGAHTWRCYGSANKPAGCADDGHHSYLLWEENDLSQRTSWEYDYRFGLPLTETTPNGSITYAQYDSLGRMISLIRPGDNSLSPTLTFSYYHETPFWSSASQKTDAGQVNTIRKIYDGLGRLIQQQQADQQLDDGVYDVLVDYAYDFRGNLLSEHMPEMVSPYSTGSIYRPLTGGSATVSTYDILGRVETITSPDNSSTATQYDLDGSLQQYLTQIKDGNNQTTTYYKDVFGRTRQVEAPVGAGVSYTYNSSDMLLTASYGLAVTRLDYDLAGRKKAMDDDDMGAWAYQYDALGNLTRQQDAKGQVTCLYYDQLNRLTGKYYSSSTCPTNPTSYNVSFGYDANSSSNSGIGYRTSMNDISGSSAWEYDLRGRVIHEEKSILDPLGNNPLGTYHTLYSYRSDDQLKQVVLPNGEALDFDYHAQGVLNAITTDHWDSGTITTIDYLKETQYDEAGRVVGRIMGNDVEQTYDYNTWTTQGGRLDTFTTGSLNNPLLNIQYDYDPVGNITELMYSSANLTESRVYSYDQLNRLRTVTIGGLVTESVSYDSDNGNIEYKDGVEYGYDSSHPHAVEELDSVQKYIYDANGRWSTP